MTDVTSTRAQSPRAAGDGGTIRQTIGAASAWRDLIPAQGLEQYWYPALLEREVPRRGPVGVRILGRELVFFRGRAKHVAALDAACPHRGASLPQGRCHFEGTVTCPFHGWTFNEEGRCVAVLGEGPNSRIPLLSSTRARAYPTQTLKGVVFVWMGEGEPAPIEEDVPEDFLDSDAYVQASVQTWPLNWRISMEMVYDAHMFYVHRNSLEFLMMARKPFITLSKGEPRRPRPENINNRALVVPAEVQGAVDNPNSGVLEDTDDRAYGSFYPEVGERWPKSRVRPMWHAVAGRLFPRRQRPPLVRVREWEGMHLPSTFRVDYRRFVYTRTAVPIDEHSSRMFYYCTTRPKSASQRLRDTIFFHVWENNVLNRQFSGQDKHATANLAYDRPEYLSSSDVWTVEWRRLVVRHARGLRRDAPAVVTPEASPRARTEPDEQE